MQAKVDRGGGSLAVRGHPVQQYLWKREEGIQRSFYHHFPVLKMEK